MSDGSPSLEEASLQDNVEETRAFLNSFTSSLVGSPIRRKPSGAAESLMMMKNAAKKAHDISMNKEEVVPLQESEKEDRQVASAGSVSVEVTTERDNESAASTRLADEYHNTMSMEQEPVMEARHRNVDMLFPQTGPSEHALQHPSLYFRDSMRSVDFVLVWKNDPNEPPASKRSHQIKREVFERGLRQEGLHLEREPSHGHLNFVKIHAPQSVLKRYSEILKLRMPMKEELCMIKKGSRYSRITRATTFITQKVPGLQRVQKKTNYFVEALKNLSEFLARKVRVDPKVFPSRGLRFTAVYSRDKEYLFDVNEPGFWSRAICSRIVKFVLDRQKYTLNPSDDFAFGIEKLIDDRCYEAAFPLHDGDLKTAGSMRNLLYMEWASLGKCFKQQPLDYVKDYFGVKIALYFAWLGFYTHMLLLAAIVGVLCFVYSVSTLYHNKPSQDVCNDRSDIMMCPLCDHWCDYWKLKETCLHTRVTYLFDNPSTVFFAIFMSFWAALFLELWKRYSAEITHRWDLTGFDVHEEHPRPQYLARLAHVKKKELNIVTNTFEPHVPFWKMRLPATILSFSIIMLLVSLALAAVMAVALYRMSVLAALSVQGDSPAIITSYAMLFTTATAATINLSLICVFNWIYTWLAEKLTEQELLRTQTEFDDSLTLKIYLLQFVNYYASIFYIAFFKGRFVGWPGQYIRFFGYRQEECGPGGCLMELCIQLSIIMVGKQAVNTVLELALPAFYRWYYYVRTWKSATRDSIKSSVQCVKDFKLVEWGSRGLFSEYLEMVLQYGFVTIFVAAFPLAPLFALLNNILEMRLDALKLLHLHRRPVPQRVRDIGVWYRILDSIGKLSVITNGLIIAFTSEFIPRMVYRICVSPNGSLEGYMDYSMKIFNISNFEPGSAPRFTSYNLTQCRYMDYTKQTQLLGGEHLNTTLYWHILAGRLAFIVFFENLVAVVMILVKWMIPDIPADLRDRIRRETYVINEIIINKERQRTTELFSPSIPNAAGDLAGMGEWDRLLSRSLTGSDFELALHDPRHMDKNNPIEV